MKLYSINGTLTPTAPFDFEQTLDFIGEFKAMANEQSLAPCSLTKTLALNGEAIVFQITGRGDAENPTLDYTLYSANTFSQAIQNAVVERMRFFLSLDDDLRPFYEIGLRDKKFAPVIEHLYGLHQVKFLTPFENAVWAVLSQRTPMHVARQVKAALTERYGPRLVVNGHEYRAFPEAAQLFPMSAQELNTLIKNERKTEYVRAVIEAFHNITPEFLYCESTEQIREWLLGIKGIGEWSADFILLRALGRVEKLSFHPNSLAMRAFSDAMTKVYTPDKPLTAPEMTRIADKYGEWQGYWGYYLRANN